MQDILTKIVSMTGIELAATVIEIMVFAFAFYVILRFLHGTRGLGIMKGILSITIILILAFNLMRQEGSEFSLPRLKFIADEFLTAMLIALIVVFQPEIRRGLSRLGEGGIFSKSGMVSLDPITQGVMRMAKRKIGALIVIQRNVGLNAYIEGAAMVNAAITAPLLESIFYPNSPLHDGAVLIQGSRITAACCLLPLSERTDLPTGMGTRHRAALGISEESDAIAIVVSEETGKIGIAHNNEIHTAKDPKELEDRIRTILYDIYHQEGGSV